METEAERRIGYRKRFLLSILAFGGLLLFLAAHLSHKVGAFTDAAFGLWAFAVAGLWFLIFATVRLLNPKPVLILGASGLTDLSPRTSQGFIAWDEIETIYCAQNGVGLELVVLLKDTEAYLARRSWWKRFNVKAALFAQQAPVSVPLTGLTASPREIMIQISQFWKAAAAEKLFIIPPKP